MAQLSVVRQGDYSKGHGCYPPRPCDSGSATVFVNGIPAHREGDHWETHGCNTCSDHDGILLRGSATVFANGLALGRTNDPIDCEIDGDVDDYVRDGSSNVFSGP